MSLDNTNSHTHNHQHTPLDLTIKKRFMVIWYSIILGALCFYRARRYGREKELKNGKRWKKNKTEQKKFHHKNKTNKKKVPTKIMLWRKVLFLNIEIQHSLYRWFSPSYHARLWTFFAHFSTHACAICCFLQQTITAWKWIIWNY